MCQSLASQSLVVICSVWSEVFLPYLLYKSIEKGGKIAIFQVFFFLFFFLVVFLGGFFACPLWSHEKCDVNMYVYHIFVNVSISISLNDRS